MLAPFRIDEIVDSPSKLAILRVFASREDLKTTGREIAKLAGFSVPSTHESLKSLYARNILNREIIGKQHIYSLNEKDRIVQKIIRPMFEAENNYKQEIHDLLLEEIKKAGIKSAVVSLILYGSVEKKTAQKESDVDVAVVTAKSTDVNRVFEIFNSNIAEKFKSFFGVHLDFYVKSATEFQKLLQKNRPPVSTLMKSYSVLYGKEPLEV
ncbi:MAG: nucleotidyltransferase domain-containing protein [Candidatus Omnitrophica bacterium]|nr:nucleotidyltransferase domain-containing protein [Candidatus Omnitrophota bacterium]